MQLMVECVRRDRMNLELPQSSVRVYDGDVLQ